MSRTACILAVDLGTGGPKVALVDERGHALVWAHHPVTTVFFPGGGAEQDAEEMWRAVANATRQVMAAPEASRAELRAVAVTSQYMSTVPVGADGHPVGPCVLWMDTRGGPLNAALLNDESFVMWLDRHGLIPLPSGTDGLAHTQWLREHRRDVYDAARAFVEPMDALTARMTGRVTATQSSAFGLLTVDNRTWGATKHDPDLVAAAGMDPAKLPELIGMDDVVGPLRPDVADELGLPAGLPVCAGSIDSITSAIGTGALTAADGSVVIGTTSVFVSHVGEKRGEIDRGIVSVPSPVPGRYFVMAENGAGGKAFEWFLREVVYADDEFTAGAVPPADAYQRLEAAARTVPPGADGVLFCPWLLGSIAPSPADDVRAAFTGVGITHSRSHLARAVMEGLALNLAWLRPHLEAFVGGEFPLVRFGGGVAQSDLMAQLLADALDRPVHQLAEPRATNARGAALLGWHQLGELDLDTVPGLLRVRMVYDPRAEQVALYGELTERLASLHPHLVPS
jgi:xylulokinase